MDIGYPATKAWCALSLLDVAAAKRPPANSASLLDLEMNHLSCRQSILPTNYLGMIERGDERHPA